eukprot:NODE_3072_length_834_cov_337.840822.p2 GENE.NODE_3072_length_834_cov_337.840822~~NODE_3072_length_834_cov_337.840822.p2  ORF type:complete len:107 (+),score=19.36 NODE_3072_length_834_cov_337.840822:327-647(+)
MMLCSIGFSLVLYTAEMAVLCVRGREALAARAPDMVCVHLAFEDTFQLILYSIVAASHAAESAGVPEVVLVASALTCAILFGKFVAVFAPSSRCCRAHGRVVPRSG